MPTNGQEPDTPPEEPLPPQERPRYRQLSRGERAGAITAGTIIGIAGFVAMFLTENEGGVAVAIILAGALLILGIQGTQLGRLGGEQVGFELMVREEERREIAERATSVAEENPAEAQAMLEGYEVADPGARRSRVVAEARGYVYEKRVVDKLRSLVGTTDARAVHIQGTPGMPDAVIEFPEGDIAVEAIEVVAGEMVGFAPMVDRARRAGSRGVLVVFSTLIGRSQVFVPRQFDGVSMEAVVWHGSYDDDHLTDALRQLRARLRDEDPEAPSAVPVG
ncbi:hypothetical protein AB0K00_20675 [Dactylosporangium sp. NPDC049525]|uniref:hypothetical protein n=1 Tax=Dactylosporangium sp. NPDC049525 TaxID=3154730 RepID=UPI00341DFE67